MSKQIFFSKCMFSHSYSNDPLPFNEQPNPDGTLMAINCKADKRISLCSIKLNYTGYLACVASRNFVKMSKMH